MSYQTEVAIQNAVAECLRRVARDAGLEQPVAAALEGLAEAIDTGDIPGDLLLRLLAGLTTPAKLLRDLADVLEDLDGEHAVDPTDLAELRTHATALEGWQP